MWPSHDFVKGTQLIDGEGRDERPIRFDGADDGVPILMRIQSRIVKEIREHGR